jgi:hypothetical protein
MYFVGPQAEAHFGGPVPLFSAPAADPTSASNYSHVGNLPGMPGDDIADMMNPEQFEAIRYPVSDLDLAALADIGWTVLQYPGLPTPPVGPKILQVQTKTSRGRTSAIVLTFNRSLDLASSQDLTNFVLDTPRRVPHKGIVYIKPIALASATYDPNAHTITLRLARPIPAFQQAQIRVTYVRDIYGHPLNGGSATPTGVPFVSLIHRARKARVTPKSAGQPH